MLTDAGYQVTYYKGSDVNVNFFQALPTYGYKILIFRVHSALRLENSTTGALTKPLDFFTSELYSNVSYASWQIRKMLDIVMYSEFDTTKYFGITPSFVTGAMEGDFQNATIILEGCNGLDGQNRSDTMLQALVTKGARIVIGWNASVGVGRTDIATLDLLNHLLAENETMKEALNATNSEIGPYDDQLLCYNHMLYYPWAGVSYQLGDVGGYRIPHGPSLAATGMTNSYVLLSANASVLAAPLLLSANGSHAFRKFRKKTSSVSRSV